MFLFSRFPPQQSTQNIQRKKKKQMLLKKILENLEIVFSG